MNDSAPQYLTKKFKKRSHIHTRNTRNANNIQLPLYKTAAGQRTFTYRGAKIWNGIRPDIKNNTLRKFKQSLKEQLLKRFLE